MHDRLKKKLCAELDKMEQKGTLSMGDLETIHKLTDTIKNLDKINTLESESHRGMGDWEATGRYSRSPYRNDSYRDNSYDDREMNSYRMYSRNDYSSSKDDLTDEIRNMLNSNGVSMEDKSVLEKAMHILTK